MAVIKSKLRDLPLLCWRDKMTVLFSLLIIVCSAQLLLVQACDPESRSLHACINTYLERDFPLLQMVFERQHKEWHLGPMLLDGPDLQIICDQIKTTLKCQKDQLLECKHVVHMMNLEKAVAGLSGVTKVLCNNKTQGLRDLLQQASCFANIRQSGNQCEDKDFSWTTTITRMLRIQQGSEMCPRLITYHQCMLKAIEQKHCRDSATTIYNRTMVPWLEAWCSAALSLHNVPIFNQVMAVFILMLAFRFTNSVE